MSDSLGATEKELIETRLHKIEEMRVLGVVPFPSKSSRDISIAEVIAGKTKLISSKKTVTIAGRLMAKRGHGKLVFADVEDESGKIQVVYRADLLKVDDFKLASLFDAGDFIEATGPVFITKAGELSIEVHLTKILAKAIRPLPEQWYGLKDEEQRLRRRYLDIILNREVKELFYKRAKFWQATRDFLVKKGFLEVETPALENTAGGADAEPFVTHHNALDMDVYLRISMGELWQKRLMVAGFEKTFEIGRQFRNEGISREHLQDYTQMEFYWAYANYEDSMKLVEKLYQHIAKETFGTYKFKINKFEVDLSGHWDKIDYTETLKKKTGVDVLKATDDQLKKKLTTLGIKFDPKDARGRLIDGLWKHIRRSIKGPVFLINHPVEVSPLAKRKTDNPKLVERYQVIMAGSEMGNGYSELNDPIDQENRFEEQSKMRADGDTEAQMHDKEFVEALEYGMPPTTGFGFSERLFSFLADKSAREAQLFPLMKPETKEKNFGRVKGTKIAVILLNKAANLKKWQELNTVGHLATSFAGRSDSSLFCQETISTSDQQKIKLNMQHAIMLKEADSNADLRVAISKAQDKGLEVCEFTNEMIETTNDNKLIEVTSKKKFSEIDFLGILIFGDKKEVEEITGQFKLKE
jgi:lysyl-tRNA synthetase, class II